ncbi:CPBP family intramembrane metalloprotease [Candidatus Marinimicrobia bacterium]|nr:CPBP family intramembrane metalloprotease [Candidatus Neomarinimicrobiota bacterium]
MNKTLTIQSAILIVIASIISAFMAGAVVLGIGLSNPDSPQKIYTFLSFIIGQSFMIVPLIWFLMVKKQPILDRLRIKKVSISTLYNTILLSFGIIIFSDELDKIIQVFIQAPEYVVDLNGLLRPESLLGFILLFIAVSIIAPLGEELLFRGFFQQILEKHWKDITRSVLVTAMIFAFIHMNPFWFAQIYILGIILGFLAWKTNSIIPSLILHGINNSMALIFSFTKISESSFYIWKGHIAPWIMFLALIFIIIGFKGINQGSSK